MSRLRVQSSPCITITITITIIIDITIDTIIIADADEPNNGKGRDSANKMLPHSRVKNLGEMTAWVNTTEEVI